ncbi:hypothetical protein HFO13_11545 [Rhizobium leguminosarum]|nr:hypothetical protein [Rhizobium laguerreae]MBY5737910.1 hypothetical protein [Rhizobium leguminosarum]
MVPLNGRRATFGCRTKPSRTPAFLPEMQP